MVVMEKVSQYERVFNRFDENGDGKISPAELRQCVEAIGGEKLSTEDAEAAVANLDSDGDGLLGFDDFVKFLEGVKEEDKVNDLKEAFKLYDVDGSGCITPRSLEKMLCKLGDSRSLDECQLMISKFDLDGDGKISFEEFKVMML
ncbi:putative calcium-binding protein CML19 [Vicia villosa]|uniref:putative calcium-binding protein CML19 n=1 Tax=Vicia villosa TaxID=3911 RepID=UPI00273ABC5A|nr:putative calcium-binding protein CML19 [Vicia villosa]